MTAKHYHAIYWRLFLPARLSINVGFLQQDHHVWHRTHAGRTKATTNAMRGERFARPSAAPTDLNCLNRL